MSISISISPRRCQYRFLHDFIDIDLSTCISISMSPQVHRYRYLHIYIDNDISMSLYLHWYRYRYLHIHTDISIYPHLYRYRSPYIYADTVISTSKSISIYRHESSDWYVLIKCRLIVDVFIELSSMTRKTGSNLIGNYFSVRISGTSIYMITLIADIYIDIPVRCR